MRVVNGPFWRLSENGMLSVPVEANEWIDSIWTIDDGSSGSYCGRTESMFNDCGGPDLGSSGSLTRTFVYEFILDGATYHPWSAVLFFKLKYDDKVTSIKLNGIDIPGTWTDTHTITDVTIDGNTFSPSSPFQGGYNTLEITVLNTVGYGYLAVEFQSLTMVPRCPGTAC